MLSRLGIHTLAEVQIAAQGRQAQQFHLIAAACGVVAAAALQLLW